MNRSTPIGQITIRFLIIAVHCVTVPIWGWGQEAGEHPTASAKLQTHRMAKGLSANIVERFSTIVPPRRMMYLSQSGQLVVYAKPDLQKKIADHIRSDRTVAVTTDQTVSSVVDETRNGNESPPSALRPVPLPRHPVQIVHLPALDLLIITTSH